MAKQKPRQNSSQYELNCRIDELSARRKSLIPYCSEEAVVSALAEIDRELVKVIADHAVRDFAHDWDMMVGGKRA